MKAEFSMLLSMHAYLRVTANELPGALRPGPTHSSLKSAPKNGIRHSLNGDAQLNSSKSYFQANKQARAASE